MFRRKLEALGYPHSIQSFTITDEANWRKIIVWLEDKKIRLYKIQERESLRNVKSSEWPKAYEQYLKDLSCPVNSMERVAVMDWLLGHAVRQEYGDDVSKYKNVQPSETASSQTSAAQLSPDDPFRHLNVEDPEYKAGLTSLAQLVNVPYHLDPSVLLSAVRLVIQQKLSKEGIEEAGNKDKEAVPFSLKSIESGLDVKDLDVNEAAKILRLLHIQELRELQTKINETIVAVQSITANPKTDQSLGKVGR